jgi:hypothetical protein
MEKNLELIKEFDPIQVVVGDKVRLPNYFKSFGQCFKVYQKGKITVSVSLLRR